MAIRKLQKRWLNFLLDSTCTKFRFWTSSSKRKKRRLRWEFFKLWYQNHSIIEWDWNTKCRCPAMVKYTVYSPENAGKHGHSQRTPESMVTFITYVCILHSSDERTFVSSWTFILQFMNDRNEKYFSFMKETVLHEGKTPKTFISFVQVEGSPSSVLHLSFVREGFSTFSFLSFVRTFSFVRSFVRSWRFLNFLPFWEKKLFTVIKIEIVNLQSYWHNKIELSYSIVKVEGKWTKERKLKESERTNERSWTISFMKEILEFHSYRSWSWRKLFIMSFERKFVHEGLSISTVHTFMNGQKNGKCPSSFVLRSCFLHPGFLVVFYYLCTLLLRVYIIINIILHLNVQNS